MAAESGADVHHDAPRWLLGLFDAAAGGIAEWSEFLAEAERLSIEVCGLSREELTTLIKSATLEIPTTQHLRLHQEASDFVRWGRRGGLRTLALYGRPYFSLLPASAGDASDKKPLPGTVLVVQRGRVGATCLRVYNHSVRVHNRGKEADGEELIERLPELSGSQLGRLEDEFRRERQRRASSAGGRQDAAQEGAAPPVTEVLEYRP